jgi:hypothetical protein
LALATDAFGALDPGPGAALASKPHRAGIDGREKSSSTLAARSSKPLLETAEPVKTGAWRLTAPSHHTTYEDLINAKERLNQ